MQVASGRNAKEVMPMQGKTIKRHQLEAEAREAVKSMTKNLEDITGMQADLEECQTTPNTTLWSLMGKNDLYLYISSIYGRNKRQTFWDSWHLLVQRETFIVEWQSHSKNNGIDIKDICGIHRPHSFKLWVGRYGLLWLHFKR